jgi:TetR/AcrR family transcriptional regulator, transcriptional repressor for nem operon
MQVDTAKVKDTKEHILQAACRLMHRQGFNNTSVEEILVESGVGKGNFYHHFKSKDDLGYAMLDRLELWTKDQVGRQILGRGLKAVDEIFELFDFIVSMQKEAKCVGGCPLGNLALELSDIHDGFRLRIEEIIGTWRGQIADVLQRAQAKGELAREVQPERMADFIFAGIEGAILLAKVRRDAVVLEGCLGELRKYVRTYLVYEGNRGSPI